jgi:hypothetical protein
MESFMFTNRLLSSAALPLAALLLASVASAQTTVDADRTTPLVTGADGEVTINTGVAVETEGGTVVTINSDDDVLNAGTIRTQDDDDSIGVLITGGVTANYTQTGSINLIEDVTPEDLDNDGTFDGPFAQGNNRIGVLISGASPFTGNVDIQSGQILIEGNNSAAIRLAADSTISGDIISAGTLSVSGDNAVGIDVQGLVIGQLANNGSIVTQGLNAQAINVENDVEGSVRNTGQIANSGFRFTTRPNLIGRNLVDGEDNLQAGAAIEINGNVSQGVFLGQNFVTTENEDGTTSTALVSNSSITQAGLAPAILIDGQGSPISIGLVATISDPEDPDFDPNLQFGFIQQGQIAANGIFDDVGATAVELADVTIEGGIFNAGSITTTIFRSGDDGTADAPLFDGHGRGFFLSENATIDDFVNEGFIAVITSEAVDEIFQDRDNIIPARLVQGTAIEISSDSAVQRLINRGIISSTATARNAEATAIIDRSGTLSTIVNEGSIFALSVNSDAAGDAATNFTNTALDLRENTSGVTINQGLSIDDNPDDVINPPLPAIAGDIILGSGDDSIIATAGSIIGNVSFGDGADILSLNNAILAGSLSDSDNNLVLTAENNSSFSQTLVAPVNVTSASFDSTSDFQTVVDGVSGEAGSLIASDTISFADGAEIGISLNNVLASGSESFVVASADNLVIEGAIDQLDTSVSPFLYDVVYSLDPSDANTLLVTLDLRSTDDLGLDSRQAAGFTSAFEALASNAQLGQAFTSITEEAQFNQAFNQLLPEISASPLYFIQANVDGAIGAVGSHLENARRSQDRSGGAWLQQFTYFADRELDGLSEQFRGFGFGFTGGFDTSWGPFHTVGANIGFASTQVEDVLGVDEPLNIVTYQAGTYAGAEFNNISLDLYGGIGLSDIESNRLVRFGDFSGQARGERNATHINGSARLGYTADLGDRFWVRPAVSLDYLRLDEEGFRETGDSGLALGVESRVSDRAGATALLNAGAVFNGNRTWIRPSLRAGYRTDFISDPVLTQFRFIDLADGSGGLFDSSLAETLSGDFPDSGFILGFTVAAGSKWSSFSFDFDSDIRDGFIRHTGRVVVRLLF